MRVSEQHWFPFRGEQVIRSTLSALVLAVLNVGCRPSTEPSPSFLVDHLEQAHIEVGRDAGLQAGVLSDVITFRGETRRAMPVPFPSRITFDVTLPPNAVLRFAVGASTMEQPTLLVPIEFRVTIDAGDGEERVFAETVRRSQPNRWFPREVDLSRWEDALVRLSLETVRVVDERPVAEQHVLPLWGNPMLVDRHASLTRPNIVLVSIDCLRADHVSAYGYEEPTTPRLDAFARQAVVFENAVATSSYTLPTHASMLTGLPPALHGARVRRAISASAPYVPEALRGAGYRVNAVVAAAFLSPTYGFHRGFHTYQLTGGRAAGVVDRALALLDESLGRTQFLFLHLYDIHAPYAAPEEFIDRFLPDDADVTDLLERIRQHAPPRDDDELARIVGLYDAEVAYVDRELGRFLDELKDRNLYDSSLILVTADHGEAFREHGAWQHGHAAALDKPGLYEEIVHVPLIVKWPAQTTGTSISDVVSQMDVAATLLAAAGLEPSSPWSVDLRRHVDTDGSLVARKTISEVTARHPEHGAGMQLAFRDGTSKYIASFRADTVPELYQTRPLREELYDLASDPDETTNLIEDSGLAPGAFGAALRSYLEAARENSPTDAEDVVLDEELAEELRALGYIDP